MEELEREEISEKEIRTYVDMLLEKNRFTYDRRIAPLLYEFFLRSHKNFNWSKDEFLDKYINFDKNVKKIKFKKLAKNQDGQFNYPDKAIYINKSCLSAVKKFDEDIWNVFIDDFYHECIHATDCKIRNGTLISHGLYKIEKGTFKSDKKEESKNLDTMLDEYVTVLQACILSSNNGLYKENTLSLPELNGYQDLYIPSTIMCTTFDVSEIKLAELKDKGREKFDEYFRNKFPYIKTDLLIECFRDNMNLIYNSIQSKDTKNTILGYKNVIELANGMTKAKILNAFRNNENEEFIQRTFYNIGKLKSLMQSAQEMYNIEEKDIENEKEMLFKNFKMLHFYKKFKDNEHMINESNRVNIVNRVLEDEYFNVELLESYIGDEYNTNMGYKQKEIADKYYLHLSKPLNDNTKLFDYFRKTFYRPSLKEKLESIKNSIKSKKQLTIPAQACVRETYQDNNLKERIQTEEPILYNKHEKVENQKGQEEPER